MPVDRHIPKFFALFRFQTINLFPHLSLKQSHLHKIKKNRL